MEMIYPDSVVAGAPIPVRLVVSAFDVPRIRGRFRDLVLHYRLVGDSAFRTTVPSRRIGITEAREAHEFTIPPYPPSTCGSIELYFSVRFDGHPSQAEGHKRIRVDRRLPPVGRANDTVLVSPSCAAGWKLLAVRTARSEIVDVGSQAAPSDTAGPSYARGLRLAVDTGDLSATIARTSGFNGVALADLTSLRYRTYVSRNGGGIGAPFLVMGIDLNGDGYVDDELQFFPHARRHVWQSWDALDGGWWAQRSQRPPSPHETHPWREYVAKWPNARLASAITIGAWKLGGSRPFDATVAQLEIGVRGKTRTFVFTPDGRGSGR
jgi:hypothetical protein